MAKSGKKASRPDASASAAGAVTFEELPLDRIDPSPLNRVYEDEAQGVLNLAESIRVEGLINPISVRPMPSGRYEIICGEGRFRASRKLGVDSIMCRVKPCDEKTAHIERLTENIVRKSLSPMKEGEGIKALLDRNDRDFAEVAKITGYTPEWVRKMERITDLIPAWREELVRPDTPYGHIAESVTKQMEIAFLPAETQQAVLDQCLFEFKRTLKEMHQALGSWMMRLGEKPWTGEWEKRNYGGSSKKRCDACVKRSDREATLFADLQSDIGGGKGAVCLDPGCWNAKIRSWCEHLLREHPAGLALWDGFASAVDVERVKGDYGVEPIASWSWAEAKEGAKPPAGFTIEATGIFLGGARIGGVVRILLRDDAGDSEDDARRSAERAAKKAEENRIREEYDAVCARVEAVVPPDVSWLTDAMHPAFFRWCAWFGLDGQNGDADAAYHGDWDPFLSAWVDNLRDEFIRTVMQELRPEGIPGVWRHPAAPATVRALVKSLEACLGMSFSSIEEAR